MINTNFFINLPDDYGQLLKIYSPTVREACQNKYFPIFKQWLTISKEEVEDEYNEKYNDASNAPDPFNYLFTDILVKNNQEERPLEKYLAQAFEFFIHEPVTFLIDQKLILIGNLEEELSKVKEITDLRFLTEENYFDFQNLVRQACGNSPVEKPIKDEDPRIKKMKAKARYRDKIKAKQEDAIDFPTTLAAICCMGIGITPLNIGEISLCALTTLTRYYQEKEKYTIDIKSILAGADSKKIKPKYWIRKI